MITTPVFQIFDFLEWGALQHLTNRLRAPRRVFGQAAGEKELESRRNLRRVV